MFFVWNIATTHTHSLLLQKVPFLEYDSKKYHLISAFGAELTIFFKENYIYFFRFRLLQHFNCSFLLLLVLCNICHHTIVIPYYYANIWEWLKSSDFGMYLAIDMVSSTLYYILICKLLTVLKKNQYYHQQQQPHVF